MGAAVFDLTGLAGYTVKPEVLRRHQSELLEAYRAELERSGVSRSVSELRAELAAALDWAFAGMVCWLSVFEAETLRDASTIQGHWERLATAMVVNRYDE